MDIYSKNSCIKIFYYFLLTERALRNQKKPHGGLLASTDVVKQQNVHWENKRKNMVVFSLRQTSLSNRTCIEKTKAKTWWSSRHDTDLSAFHGHGVYQQFCWTRFLWFLWCDSWNRWCIVREIYGVIWRKLLSKQL